MESFPRARKAVAARVLAILVVMVGLMAIAAIVLLQQRTESARNAELKLAGAKVALGVLQVAPFSASSGPAGPAHARALIDANEKTIDTLLGQLRDDSHPAALDEIAAPLAKSYALNEKIYAAAVNDPDFAQKTPKLGAAASGVIFGLVGKLDVARREYAARARRSADQATVGSATVILLLLGAFGFFYRRAAGARKTAEHHRAVAEGLVTENEGLLAESRKDSRTDALTGLGNRRALVADLTDTFAAPGGVQDKLLGLFDLDGFKQYNDTFGHPAGDALLTRLGGRLMDEMDGIGTAYRMGGDEFCILASAGAGDADAIPRRAAAALSESGDAFAVGCSFGVAHLPSEASSVETALGVADERMYEDKTGRSTASRQSTDVLLAVLSERSARLGAHAGSIVRLAQQIAEDLQLPESEVKRIALGAELHDVGKVAIPDAVLDKPGPLSDPEWTFVRQHTLIGERIVLSAQSLADAAGLVRSSHERVDGTGYPDGLRGDEIEVGAGIIGVCDAFVAMRCQRPYRRARSTGEALAELRRGSGTQFLPAAVEALCALVARQDAQAAPAPSVAAG